MGRPMVDLTGQKFGMLTVLNLSESRADPEINYKKEYRRPLWHCKCDCGAEVDVKASYLQQVKYGRTVPSCGCHKFAKSDVGKKYKNVEIIDQYHDENQKIHYKCRCICGNIFDIDKYTFLSDIERSCGCLKERKGNVRNDLVGQKFGYLTVVKRDPNIHITKGGKTTVYWVCRCDCGRMTSVSYSVLKRGNPSCGCVMAKKQHISINEYDDRYKGLKGNDGAFKDISGMHFGLLTAIEPIKEYSKSRSTYWICKCECGNTKNVPISNLLNRHTKSCGCISSVGEMTIRKELDKLGVKYIQQHRFKDCKDIKPLPFDFSLIHDNSIVAAIEYDGLQHFQPVRFNGMTDEQAEAGFKECVEHDRIKNEYCKDNNIRLLRINYKQMGDIDYVVSDFIKEIFGEKDVS